MTGSVNGRLPDGWIRERIGSHGRPYDQTPKGVKFATMEMCRRTECGCYVSLGIRLDTRQPELVAHPCEAHVDPANQVLTFVRSARPNDPGQAFAQGLEEKLQSPIPEQ